MGMRTNTAQWLPNQNRWQIKVQKDGVRKTFTSAKPGRTGQREANAKADAWLDEGICSTTKRCSEVWNEYLISVRATAGTSYAQQVEKFGQNYILPVVGDRRIGDLNTGMLQDVLNRAYKEGSMNPQAIRKSRGNLSRKTLQGIRAVEVSFVKWARQHKYTALRPEDEGLTVPRGARPKGRKILQPDALRVLLSVDTRIVRGKVEQDANIHAYRFAVLTGLRPGELLGLRVGDMEGNRLHLARAINTFDEETHGKNENAIRSFDMGEEAHEAYEAQVALLKASDIPLNYTTPLFQIPNQRALFKRWKKYQRDNGIEPQVTLYEMRHTFVSIESGVLTDSQLKMLVGHSKNMDTAGVYRHELDGQREDLAAATTAAFRKAQG